MIAYYRDSSTKLDAVGITGTVGKISMEHTGIMDMTGRAEHCMRMNKDKKYCTLAPGHDGVCDFNDKGVHAMASGPSKSNHDMRGIDHELDPDD
jgi:hypothetical protein